MILVNKNAIASIEAATPGQDDAPPGSIAPTRAIADRWANPA
jgi:hypothetical protein